MSFTYLLLVSLCISAIWSRAQASVCLSSSSTGRCILDWTSASVAGFFPKDWDPVYAEIARYHDDTLDCMDMVSKATLALQSGSTPAKYTGYVIAQIINQSSPATITHTFPWLETYPPGISSAGDPCSAAVGGKCKAFQSSALSSASDASVVSPYVASPPAAPWGALLMHLSTCTSPTIPGTGLDSVRNYFLNSSSCTVSFLDSKVLSNLGAFDWEDVMDLWWSSSCIGNLDLNTAFSAAVLQSVLAFQQSYNAQNPGSQINVTLDKVTEVLQDYNELERICSARSAATCTNTLTRSQVVDDVSYASTSSTCGSVVLNEFSNCCSNQSVLDRTGAGLIGSLPDSFVPALNYTSFRDNPKLCGVIDAFPNNLTSETPVLFNSQVKLELDVLENSVDFLIIKVLEMLGDRQLAHNNLQGNINDRDAVRACAFLDTGAYTALQWNLNNKECDAIAPTQFDKWGLGCYQVLKYGVFKSELRKDRAVAEYNRLQKDSTPAFQCGKDGLKYREQYAGLLWAYCLGGVLGIVLISLFLCSNLGNKLVCGVLILLLESKVYKWANLIVQFLLFFWDEYSDWNFIYEGARYGNVTTTTILGWLLMGKNYVLLFLGVYGIYSSYVNWKGRGNFFLAAFLWLVLFLHAAGAVLLVGTTKGTLQVNKTPAGPTGDQATFCVQDAQLLFVMFVGNSVCGALLQSVIIMLLCYGHAADKPWKWLARTSVMLTIYSLVFHDCAQAVAQGLLWVYGRLLTPAPAYFISVIPCAARIGVQLFELIYVIAMRKEGSQRILSSNKIAVEPAGSKSDLMLDIKARGSLSSLAAFGSMQGKPGSMSKV